MSAFKDAIAREVDSVFLNADEFADVHDINGTRVKCIIDKDIVQEAEASLEGVFVNALTLYIRVGDIKTPAEGATLYVDGKMHLVRNVSVEDGMLVIVAEVNES